MRNTVLTFVAATFLATFSHAEDPWTPSPLCPYPSEELTRFPYEYDCTKFWECFEGARYPMTCPEGLEYNEAESRCDDPTIANWQTITYPTFSHETDSTATPSGFTADPLCPYPSEALIFYPNPDNCTQYYECYQGKKFLMNCPAGLYWNVNHNYCDYLENVDCSQNNITLTPATVTPPGTTTTTGPWTPDPICPYPSDAIIFYPNPANCSTYWECYEGNKYLMDCPNDLLWNDLAKTCDYAVNVDCSSYTTVTAYTATTAPTIPTAPTAPPTSTTTTGPTIPTAPTAPPTGSTNATSATTATTKGTTADPGPSCANQADGTFLPNTSDCTKFFECAGGEAIPEQCPGSLLWNNVAKICDYEENLRLMRRIDSNTMRIIPSGSTAAPSCPNPSDDLIFYPNPDNCTQYYECYQGNLYLMSCPGDLYWNVNHDYCDYLENVDCSQNNITSAPTTVTSPETTTTAPWTPDPLCPYPSYVMTFYPNPADCSTYWQCYMGNKFLMTCPYGLVWNNPPLKCDHPENVDCSSYTYPPTVPTDTTSATTATTKGTTADPGPSCANQPDGSLLPNTNDCTKFFECAGGEAIEQQCPGDLFWNNLAHLHLMRRRDGFAMRRTLIIFVVTFLAISSIIPSGSTAAPSCPYPSDDPIFYPNPDNCAQYYECYQGNLYLLNCPGDLYWNINHNYCDYLENVDCSQNNITSAPTTVTSPGTTTTAGPWTPDPICPYPSEVIIFYPNPANCSTYWECYEGNKYLMSCPDGLLWNDLARTCDYAVNVDCSSYTTVTAHTATAAPTTPTTPTLPPTGPTNATSATTTTTKGTTADPGPSCANQPDGSFIPNINDCTKFFECAGGEAIPQACPDGLFWNNVSHICDYEENVKCITS
ncbi:hypothetical protein NQ318_004319 [Aromia moschata]|uniref:Chitin-binding type-2 domain-containing protein n=1 Tax=Aromia moschata TaxID=1265417 RepID=A0AAV8YSM6_9CUCU|nr:hypothetical protein NQ318_004319 [Aromia moschata]